MILPFLIAWLATKINCHQGHVIAYLCEENRILKAKLKGKRIQLTDTECRCLAVLAHPIERKQLKDLSTIVTADTLQRWYRRLVVQSPGPMQSKHRGRPRVVTEIERLAIRMANENPTWGYRRIQGALSNVGYDIDKSTGRNILRRNHIDPAPIRGRAGMSWSQFVKLHWDVLAASGFFEARLSIFAHLWTFGTQLIQDLSTRVGHLQGLICHRVLSVPTLMVQLWRALWSDCLASADTRCRFVFSRCQRVMDRSSCSTRSMASLSIPYQGQIKPIGPKRASPDEGSVDLTFTSRRVRGRRDSRLSLGSSTRGKYQSNAISDESRCPRPLADSYATAA